MGDQIILPDELSDSTARLYTHARVANGTLYMSGQVGWTGDDAVDETEFEDDDDLRPGVDYRPGDGTTPGSDIEAQTEQAFRNVEIILEHVDKELSDVRKVTSYFTDIERDFAGYKTVWGELFDEPYPAHTAIGVEALAAEDLLLEIEAEVPLDE